MLTFYDVDHIKMLCRYGETFDLSKHPQVCFLESLFISKLSFNLKCNTGRVMCNVYACSSLTHLGIFWLIVARCTSTCHLDRWWHKVKMYCCHILASPLRDLMKFQVMRMCYHQVSVIGGLYRFLKAAVFFERKCWKLQESDIEH